MITSLLMLLPQEALLPMMVIGGILVILGFRRAGFGIVGTVIAFGLFGPFMDALIDSLPPWLFALLVLGFVLFLFRLVFGQRVVENLISYLLYDLLLAPFRFLRWLVRGFGPRPRR